MGRPINKQLENCKSTKIYTDHLENTNTWQCADMWNACAVLRQFEGKMRENTATLLVKMNETSLCYTTMWHY